MKKFSVGLALGSGAARGYAHIGVIKALEEAQIPIDVIAGTSIGAVVGGLYAAGLSVLQMTKFATGFGRKRLAFWLDPSFFRGGGLLKGDRIEQALIDLTGPMNFSDLNKKFYAVAADLMTGKRIVIDEGDFHGGLRASFAIPGIFSPIKKGDSWLVDGAIVDPIPTHALIDAGCNFIIGVSVNAMAKEEAIEEKSGAPGLLEVLMQTLSVTQLKLSEHCMKLADIEIVPEVGDFSWTDFSRAEELIEVGYNTTKKMIPQINRQLSRRQKLSFVKRILE